MSWSYFNNFNNFDNFSNFVGHTAGYAYFDIQNGGTQYGGQVNDVPGTLADLSTAVTPYTAQGYDTYYYGPGNYDYNTNYQSPYVYSIYASVTNAAATDQLALNFPTNEFTLSGNEVLLGGQVFATFSGGTSGQPLQISIESAYYTDYQHIADLVHSVWYQDNANGPNTRQVQFQISNSQNGTEYETVTVNVSQAGPVLSSVPQALAYREGDPPATVAPALSLADSASTTLTSATVQLTGGTFAGDGDVLAVNTAGTSITASYDSTAETLTLTGTDTLADYQTVLQSVTYSSPSQNPDDYGSDPTRLVTWTVDDGNGSLSVGTATETIQITAVNNPPTLSNTAGSAAFTEEGGAVTLSNAVSITDPDSLDLTGATVSITGGTFAGDSDVLAATGTASISVSYNSATETLTLTGTDTLADYQAVLDTVTFNAGENPTDFGSNPTRMVVWTLNDGSGSNNLSTPVTSTVSITNVNDPPTLANVATSASFTEEGGAVTLSPSVTATGPDNLDLASATISITGGTFAGDGDVLAATTTGTSITASYNSSTETLTLSGSDTLADYQQVLDTVTFSAGENPTDFGSNPTRTVTWTLNDGSGSNSLSTPVTSTVSIINVNDPPTLANVATSASFAEESGAVTLSNAVSVTDPDDIDLTSATVSIAGGTFASDGDVLSATGTASIAVSYNSSTETLTLTGTDTLADYQAVLDTVTFNAGENPTDFGSNPSRTVVWTLNDGSGSNNLSTLVTSTVSITNVNDPPTLANVAASASFTEEGGTVTLSNAVTVTDPDDLNLSSATVSITGGTFAGDGDALAANPAGTSITASYNSTSETLTLTGSDTLAHYQQVLDTVTFSAGENPTDFGSNPTRTLTWTLNDGSGSNNLGTAVTSTVNITNVNDPPTLAGVAASASFTEGQTVTLSPSVTATDPDSLDLASATVSITGGTFAGDGDVLAATTTGTSITASYSSTSETLTLSGSDTLAHYRQVLDTVTFNAGENPTDFGSFPTRTVTWVLNDGGSSNNLSTSATTTVGVTNVNDPPTLASVAASVSFTEGQTVTLSPSVTVTDPDNFNLASATVSIAGGTFAGDGDVLAANTAGTSITASYSSTSETLTLSGADTLAHYRQVLDTVTFASGLNPDDYGSVHTRTVTWVLNDGGSSSNTSTAQTETINVTAIHNPPTLSNLAPSAAFTEGQTVTLSPSLAVSDPDNLNLAGATVSIAGGTFAGDGDVLAANTVGTSITAGYNSTTETLTLTGSDTVAHYQQVLDSVTFTTPSTNADNDGSNPIRTVTWVVNDGSGSNNLSAPATTTIDIADNPPTLTNVAASVAFTEGNATTLSPSVSVSDSDNLTLAGATVAIAGGTFAGDGDVLAANTAGTSITASFNSTSETLTLSGSDTLAHYRQVLDTITFASGLNPDDYGSTHTRTVSWVLNDGAASSALATTTINITAINNPPTLSNVASASFTENGGALTLAPAATVSDPDSLTLSSAFITLQNAFTGDALNASTAGTNITLSGNGSAGLVLSGADTLAHYQQVLRSVSYTSSSANPTDYGSDPTRTVTWVLSDGAASNNVDTVIDTFTVVGVNNPPTLAGTAASVGFTEGQTVTLSPSVTATDPDNLDLAGATVSIAGGTFAGDGDALAATTTGTSITASYSSTSETLTLTGSDTLAHYQQVLDTVTFSAGENPTDFGSNPTRTLTWTLNDGSGSNNLSTAVTSTVNIANVNDPPTLAGVAASASFTEEGGAVTLSPSVTATDPDSLDLASATVSITGGTFAGDGDVLAATTTGTSITASYSSVTERLTLTGADTLAHYAQVLDSVTFNGGENPTDFGSLPTRTVTWVLNDGGSSNNLSTVATTTVGVTNVNDPPTLASVAASVSFTEGQTVTLSPSVTATDPDNLNLASATVSITGGTFAGDGDVLTANTAGTSITASYNSTTERLTLSGSDSLVHYRQVLDTVTFASGLNPDDYGSQPSRVVTWVLNDGGSSSNTSTAQTETINITAINNPPTLSNLAPSAAFTEGQTVTLSPSLAVADPDNLNLANATVSIASGTFAGDGDVLAANTAGTSITAGYNSTTETLTLTGSDTVAHYQQVLDSVTFTTPSTNADNDGSNPIRTVTWVVNDGGASNNLTTATTTISIANVAPTLTNVAASVAFTEGNTTTLSGTVSVSDSDNLTLASATVAIATGTFAGDGDVLVANTAGTGITASFNSTSETLTLSGSDTLAHYQQVLDTITFASGLNPDDYGSVPTRAVTWVLNDGAASNNLSAAATTTINVTAINNPPTLSNVASASFTENGGALTLAPAATVSDPDNLTLSSAFITLQNAFTGDALNASTAGTNITLSGNGSAGLVLSGADTLAHYQQVLRSLSYTSSSANPTDYGSDPTRTVTWVLSDGAASNNVSTVIDTFTVVGVNNPPTLAGTAASVGFTENGAAVTLSPSVTATDPDNLNLAGATVSIAGGTFAGDGDVLAATTTGTSITASYSSTSETLTLTGSDTLAHYAQVLDTVTFATPSSNPDDYGSAPTRTVTWVLNDGSGSSNLSASATTTVNVTAINNPPTLAGSAASASFTEGNTLTLSPSISVSDVDNLRLANATVAITGGTFAGDGDVLAATTTGTSITASYNSSTETLTLTGSDTLAHYQQVLDAVTFASGANPDDYGSQHSRTVTWVVNDGSSSSNLSTPATTAVSITAINNAPALSGVAASARLPRHETAVVSPALSVSDVDSLNLANAFVFVTGGTFAGDGDVLAANTTGTSITASYNSSTETLALSGVDTLAHYQQVLDSVSIAVTGGNPTDSGSNPTRVLSWLVSDGAASNFLSTPRTTTVSVGSFVSNDFNGDGISDVLWRNASGEVDTWLMNNGQMAGGTAVGSVSSAWRFAGAGDITGNGTSDVLWQNTSTGEVDSWLINNGNLSGGAAIGHASSVWQPLGSGDFNADGTSDVLWRNANTGEVDTWLMNNGQVSGGAAVGSVSSAWQFAGIGDFNGDGTSDVLWHNAATGEVDTWLISNDHVTGGSAIGHASSVWQSLGTGDFNGDGTSDILWRNTSTGEVDTWLMNNGQMTGGAVLGTMSSAWQLAGIGDLTGNGTSDVVWRNTTTGQVQTWLISNDHVTGGSVIGTVSTAWQPQVIHTS
jgi:hypothetical protein